MRVKIAVVCGFVSMAGFGLGGCRGTLEALGLPKDMTVSIAPDLAGADNDGGNGTVVHFGGAAPSIQADIDAAGCAVVGCHTPAAGMTASAGNPLNLTAMATGAALDANYMSFKALTTPADPTMSLIIVNAVDATNTHTGGPIITMGDEVYNRWIAWIGGGEPE